MNNVRLWYLLLPKQKSKPYIMKKILFLLLLISFGVSAQNNESKFNVGDLAPEITGVDQYGNSISTKTLKEQGKQVLVIFYRGNWCPYCQKHLKELDDKFQTFEEKGVSVIVISPEKPEKMEDTAEDFENQIPLIFDQDNTIMQNYGVAFELPNDFSKWTLKRVDEYNTYGNRVLPVPATYLIGLDGKIVYVHYDPNYHNRSDLEELLETL